MARITVEDCSTMWTTVFDLVLLASRQRSSWMNGVDPGPLEERQATVVALRERFAEGLVTWGDHGGARTQRRTSIDDE